MQLPEAITSVLDQGLEYIYALGPVFEPTVVLVPSFVRIHVKELADQIGFDVETLNYTLGMFLCYPLAMIMNSLPYGQIRHIFSFLLGAFLLQFVIGVQWIHHVITCVIVYVLFLVLPSKLASKVVPAFVFLYLVFGHLHRQYVNYLGWDLDFTGTHMVLTQKLYMLAFNLYDGQLLASGKDDKAAKKCAQFALPKLPSFIEFLGYTFSFSNLLAGPAYEFTLYRNGCDGSHLHFPDGKPRGKIPSNVMPSLKPFLLSLVCLVLFVVGGGMFPILDKMDPQKNDPVIIQPEFLEKPWIYRYFYLWLGLVFVRQKYYFAWKNAEGCNNIFYAGFEGFDEKGNPKGWANSDNVNIVDFETAPNMQTLSKEWNKKTSSWLTRYVYIRTNGSLLAVYSMSAFWHGFYPGYYLFFLSVPLITMCERLGRKKISPHFSDARLTPYGVATTVATSFVANYMVSSFIVLALDRTWRTWASHYFIGHILCVLFYALLTQLPSAMPKKKTA